MDFKEVQSLIKFVAKSGVSEVKLKVKDFEISIKNNGSGDPTFFSTPGVIPAIQSVTPAAPLTQGEAPAKQAPAAATEDLESKYQVIKSPMIGTFYSRSAPEKSPFVSVGEEISQGKVICIIEAMKLFNEIESEFSGKLVKILVEDSTPVEFDQPLFLIDPS
ncbi:MAG: acetyl-CoA carboxylase biotin carboxyl carrier protein [Flavobacteriaceae bacterium]|nr:MAG: acetyl-CoA carboxylase biotin carboxyl carrier protein [Flavobacteriaceae bacterium]